MDKNKATLAIYGIKDRNIFQYPAYVHDHNICLWENGKVIWYHQLERLSRRKYDNRLDLYIEDILESKKTNLPDDFDVVCVNDFVGNSFISTNGRLRFEYNYSDKLEFSLNKGRGYYQFDGWNGKSLDAYLCSHEVAHICSTLPFFGEFKNNSLLVSIDGGSSLGNYSAFLFKDGRFTHIDHNWNDLGYASKLFNDNALSFRMLNARPGDHCAVPGKLMGFASYGISNPKIEKWIAENGYFREYWNKESDILKSIKDNFGIDAEFSTHDKFMQNIAASIQHIFEQAILDKLKKLQDEYHADYLYYGGGCALNIVTNTKIVESGMFKDIFIAPCCNDSGLSLGAGAFMEMMKGHKIELHTPYLNSSYSNSDEICPQSIEKAAEIILKDGVIGVCNGNGEIGPRALGNRSLIALPNSNEVSKKVSMKIKKREWYRPVAPIMLKEIAQMVSVQNPTHLSEYMLQDFLIKPEYRSQLQGVTHINGTSRIQTIDEKSSCYFMYQLLKHLYNKYGILALINTSFNIQGQPIVDTQEQAIEAFDNMGLDALIINNKIITK